MPRVHPRDLQREWDMSFRLREQEQIHLFYLPGGMNYARLSFPSQILMRLYRFYMLHSSKTRPDTRELMRRLDRSVDYTCLLYTSSLEYVAEFDPAQPAPSYIRAC